MKYINIISLIIVLLILSSCSNNKLAKDQDAVYKKIQKTYTLHEDGSINYRYQHQLKYITHFSFNRLFGESFIVYNPEQQEVVINKAETKMVSGKIVPSPENAFNKVLPRFAAGVPAYNHLRELVVTHTALEPGCMVNFDYEVRSKAGYLPYFCEKIILQEIVPVENLEIIVNIPDDMKLNYKLIKLDKQAEITKKEGFTQYKWNFKNLESRKSETNQAHDQLFLPGILISSVSLEDAFKTLYSEKDLILSDDIKNLVRKRTFGMKKGIQIIRELQRVVGSELNDLKIPIEYSAYSIRPLNEVWSSNGGTKMEKTLLLNEFIKHIGFDSEILMAISPVVYDKNLGCLKDFGHLYIRVHVDGEDLIISTDPHQSNSLAFELKETGLIDQEGRSVNLPDFVYDLESSFAAGGNLQINESGDLSGKLNFKVQGLQNPYLSYLEDIQKAKKVAISMVSDKAITDFNVLQFDPTKSEIEARIEQKEIWKSQGNYYFIELPTSNYGIKGEHLRTLLAKRQTPLKLSNPINESYDFNISIPEGLSFVGPGIQQEVSNEIGSVQIEMSSKDQVIHISKSLKMYKEEISPAEYNQFKKLMDVWNKKSHNEIILKKSILE